MQNLKKSKYSIEGWVALMRWICLVLMLSVMMPTWAASIPENIADIAKGWWGGLWSNTTEAEAQRGMMTRGKPLAMPLLENKQQLVAGKGQLFLGWKGGVAPFTVEVPGHVSPRTTNDNFIRLPVTLKAGDYTVTVTDKTEIDVQGEFTVLNSLPTSLESEIESKLGIKKNPKSEEEKLLFAMGLLASGWKFEAYQWVANINRKDERVWRTKLALEIGRSTRSLTQQ